jgi:hypothetical protein
MKSKIIVVSLLCASLAFTWSCAKEEGYGGNSHIKGTIIEKVYNDDYSELIYEQNCFDEEVFIVFQDGVIGDKGNTNFNGLFQFEYLFPGNYQIYYYSDNQSSAYGDNIEIVVDVELKKNETIDLGELIKKSSVQFDDGSAAISGQVYLINYLNSSQWPNLLVKDTSFAQDHEVYLVYGEHNFFDERIHTHHNGTFLFPDLIKGKYTVYLYSEDVTGGTEDVVVSFDVEIVSEFEELDLGTIYIEQL